MTDRDDSASITRGPRMPAHVYVHVPFCASKCGYCDFASVSGADDGLVGAVFRGIRGQLSQWRQSGLDGVLDTVYVGGGTPSLVADHVVDLLEYVRRAFVVHPTAEITVEANPDSIDGDRLSRLRGAGVTRVSVGVQSFDDTALKLLGRRHDARQALRACEVVRDAGLPLSVDLMCGIPGQTVSSWSETLDRAVASGAVHASVYPLQIEDGTPMQVAVSAGLLDEPDPDRAAEMMLLAEEFLGHQGLKRYEVANYADSPAHQSAHNTAYWTGRAYIGVGPAAHGMLDAVTARAIGLVDAADDSLERVRYANAADIDEWLTLRGDTVETLSVDEAVREDIMLGMRLTRGVSAEQIGRAQLTQVFESLSGDGLVTLVGEGPSRSWRTTTRGWLLGNEVFGRIWNGQ